MTSVAWADERPASLVLETRPGQKVTTPVGGLVTNRWPHLSTLGRLDGVDAVGVILRQRSVVAAQLPQQPIDLVRATPGLAGLLNASVDGAGVWVSREVADVLGARVGSTLVLDGTPARVASVFDYPDDGRRPGLGFAIIEPTPAGRFDECWLRQWPSTDRAEAMVSWSLVPGEPGGSTEVAVSALNSSFGSRFEGAKLFADRLTRPLSSVGGVVGFLICLAFGRLRRLEWSSSRHAGVPLRALMLTALVETLSAAAAAVALVAPLVTWMLLPLAPEDLPGVAVVALRGALLVVLGAALGTAAAATMASERRLFAYFKSR